MRAQIEIIRVQIEIMWVHKEKACAHDWKYWLLTFVASALDNYTIISNKGMAISF